MIKLLTEKLPITCHISTMPESFISSYSSWIFLPPKKTRKTTDFFMLVETATKISILFELGRQSLIYHADCSESRNNHIQIEIPQSRRIPLIDSN